MKPLAYLATGLLAAACAFTSHAQQLQRLAILQQKSARITPASAVTLKTLSIDYYRNVPDATSLPGQPPYNQLYSEQGVTVKVNGVKSAQTLRSMLEGDKPLLLLVPLSNLSVTVKMNPANPNRSRYQALELEFAQPCAVGNIVADSNVQQSAAVFATWGNTIAQEDFYLRAKCLDLLVQNNKVAYPASGPLPESARQLCDQWALKSDFILFPSPVFRTLVMNNTFMLDAANNLTAESMTNILNALAYEQSVTETKKLSGLWQTYAKAPANVETDAKVRSLYYSGASRLTQLGRENKAMKDTVINGSRYVLMVAWKSASFKGYLDTTTGPLPIYKSSAPLYQYALFLTTRADMERWALADQAGSFTQPQCRSRLMQLLGLPPNSTNDMFVEFWAREQDIFRPTIDSSLVFSSMITKYTPEYLASFAQFSAGSFPAAGNLYQQYPFTGLGYTWDCSPLNPTHFGVSEFVLRESRITYIRQMVPTMTYIRMLTAN